MPTLLHSARVRLPCLVGADPTQTNAANALSGLVPAAFSATDLRFELGLLASDGVTVFTDISIIDSLTLRVKTAQTSDDALMAKTLASSELNQSLTQNNWANGGDQHAAFEFTNSESNLIAAGASATQFWLHAFYTTTDSPAREVTIYSGPITFYPPRIPLGVGPISGGSIIPGGATYDGSVNYALSVTANQVYSLSLGAHDSTVTNGAETLSAGGDFTAQGSSLTLHGTANATVTAVVRAEVYLTAAQSDARYGRDFSALRLLPNGATDATVEDLGRTIFTDAGGADSWVQLNLPPLADCLARKGSIRVLAGRTWSSVDYIAVYPHSGEASPNRFIYGNNSVLYSLYSTGKGDFLELIPITISGTNYWQVVQSHGLWQDRD